MSLRRAVMFLAVITLIAIAYFSMRPANRNNFLAAVSDPAFAFYNKEHSAAFGGIDQWSHYGMKAERVAELLKKDGYACIMPQPPADGEPPAGIQKLTCSKLVRWPLSRMLTVSADIDYDMRGRLAGASATSTTVSRAYLIQKFLAGNLRKFKLIEPESMRVRGFEVDTPDKLARLAVDALSTSGWHANCEEDRTSIECQRLARNRREVGFPALPPNAIPVSGANSLYTAMDRVRLLPHANTKAGDDLIVRIFDGQIWMDFFGKDLTGRSLKVSIEVQSEGGKPVQLIAQVDKQTHAIPLAGESELNNAGKELFLVPTRGGSDFASSTWLDIPGDNNAPRLKKLAQELPKVDAAFVPAIVKATIGRISGAVRPEESLGLYPALRLIEQRAEFLRSAQTPLWLPEDQSVQMVRKTYPEDSITRAAWALAACESADKPPVIDSNCWLRHTVSDSEVTDLLRKEVGELAALYAGLEVAHPLRLRLERLRNALEAN